MDIDRLGDLDFRDKRVTVVGLGIEGVDLVRYLARQGAIITVSDSKQADKLTERIEEIERLPVRLSLGKNEERDVVEADAVFVSQGVPLDLPALQKARERGVPMRSMLGLYLELCPGPITGITGSSGKTTTTALVGEMFQADERPVFVGGNIGVGLLDRLSSVRPYTWTVLEVSHTQLQLVDRSPHVAAVLNITPNHLDRFAWDEYRALKANLVRFQQPSDTAVLNADDPECLAIARWMDSRPFWFSMTGELPGEGVCVREGWALARYGRMRERLFALDDVRLLGEHNRQNAVAAAAIALACGVSPEAIACAIESFRGVPHRLEPIAEVDGVQYYNDSIATTPERTIAGLRSFDQPVVLLLGGRDKHLPLEALVNEASSRCRAVILFGESAGKLEESFREHSPPTAELRRVGDLEEGVARAHELAHRGDIVLLSPACTSYDAYENFEQRGEHFRGLVQQMIKEVQPSLP